MSEIALNQKQIDLIRKAIADGSKSFVTHDLLISIYDGGVVKVTNAHTGDEMKILNITEI